MVMSTASIAPVASVFPSRASASFPCERLSPMMPEPTTVVSNKRVPSASASKRREYDISSFMLALNTSQENKLHGPRRLR